MTNYFYYMGVAGMLFIVMLFIFVVGYVILETFNVFKKTK